MNEEYYKEYLGEFIDEEIKPFDINAIENRHKSALEIMDIRAKERLYKDSLKKAKEKDSDND